MSPDPDYRQPSPLVEVPNITMNTNPPPPSNQPAPHLPAEDFPSPMKECYQAIDKLCGTPAPAGDDAVRGIVERLLAHRNFCWGEDCQSEAYLIDDAIAALQRLAASLDAEIGARNGWWDNCKKAEADLLEVESELTAARAATDRMRVALEETSSQLEAIKTVLADHLEYDFDYTNTILQRAKRALAEGGES